VLYALRLAEAAELELQGPEQTTWLARLEQEHDNLRATLRWCEQEGYAEPACRLAGALWWFWLAHGHVGEGRDRLASLLARFPAREGSRTSAALRSQVLYGAGVLASHQGDHAASHALHTQAVSLRRTLDDRAALVSALEGLGTATNLQGDHLGARRHLEEALAIAQELGDPRLSAGVLHDLGNVAADLGDFELAHSYFDQAAALVRRAGGDPLQLGTSYLDLAVFSQERGAYDEAHALASEALALFQQAGYRHWVAMSLANLGATAVARGAYATAHDQLGESIAILRELGERAGSAFVLERFAALAAAQDRHAGAIRLAGAAAALRQTAGAPLPPSGQARLDRGLEPARRALGEAGTAEAWDAGRRLTLDEAMAEAMTVTEPGAGAESSDAREVSVLTPREREVAALIARGYTNRQIAQELIITEGTVASHVVHILNKLGVGSRAQVAVWATEQGLKDPKAPSI
jgi:non-specific serine/threonine protein kinase